MVSTKILAAAFAAVSLGVASHAVAAEPCTDLVPPAASAGAAKRPVTSTDLIRIRDLGLPDALMLRGESPLGVSPDGSRAAFVLVRPDPATNEQCRGLFVLDLKPGAQPRLVDRGGEMIRMFAPTRNMVFESGYPNIVEPKWSPDGAWIAYRKRLGGVTQAFRVRADGGAVEQLTRGEDDVEALGWSADGHTLLYVTRPGIRATEKEIEKEGTGGWLYDARFSPNFKLRPLVDKNLDTATFALDLGSQVVRVATAEERASINFRDTLAAADSYAAVSPQGRKADLIRVEPDKVLSPLQVRITAPASDAVACSAAACTDGVRGVWWSQDGSELRYLRSEGWAKEDYALYRWKPGTAEPVRVLSTTDVLNGCVPVQDDLLCLRENATTTRRVVRIDMATGTSTELFDPNPEFASIQLGKVERLKFRSERGDEAWGDLVLPPDHNGERKLPLVVVQYHSDGFLRGGTGDDYPVHVLAQRGFAVLSFERPTFVRDKNAKDWNDIIKQGRKNWAERRNVFSALEAGVKQAVARGIADPARLGISGLSDGSTTTRWALIHAPKLFAAAAISTCCAFDSQVANWAGGEAFAQQNRMQGYPLSTAPSDPFWTPISFPPNADKLDTPLLIQTADDELILALQSFTALKEHNKPVEMYVYPDAHHIKWQPAQRLATYERNLDWFAFWLQDKEDPDPAKAAQYARWRKLRAGQSAKKKSS